MQDIQLFKEFIQFCEEQPKDTTIDHSGSWSDCAVGKFFNWQDCDEDTDKVQVLLGNYWLNSSLANRIGNGECPSNYGDFTTFLKLELDKLGVMVDNGGISPVIVFAP